MFAYDRETNHADIIPGLTKKAGILFRLASGIRELSKAERQPYANSPFRTQPILCKSDFDGLRHTWNARTIDCEQHPVAW